MSRIFREIIRKQSSSSTRFITTFTQQNPRNHHLPPLLLFNQSILGQTPNFDHESSTFNFNLNPKTQGLTENVTHLSKLQIYPGLSSGYLIDPISASGVEPIGVEVETGHPGMMWADSVKKKRKKKMNKHKYKKLRKRLRRKTKT